MSTLGEQIQQLERMLADGQIELALEGYERLFAQLPTDQVLRNRVNFLRDSLHRHAPKWQVRTYVISPRAVAEAHILAERYAVALEILEWLLENDPSDNGLARRVAMVRAMRNGTTDVGIEPTASTSLMTPEMLVEAHLAGGDVAAALHLLRSLASKRPHDQRLQDRLRGLKAAWGKDDAEISRRLALRADEVTDDATPAVDEATAASVSEPEPEPELEREPELEPAPEPAPEPALELEPENRTLDLVEEVADSDQTVATEPPAEVERVTETDAALPLAPPTAEPTTEPGIEPAADRVSAAADFDTPLAEQQTIARARPLSAVRPAVAIPQAPPPGPPPLPAKRPPRSVTDPKRDGYGILRGLLEDAEQALQQEHVQRVPTDQVRSAASPLQSERPTNPSKHSARRKAVEDFGVPAVSPAAAAGPAPASALTSGEAAASAVEVAGQVRGRRRRKKLRQAHDTGSAKDLVEGDPQQPLESKLLHSPHDNTASHDIELFDIHEALTAPDGRSLAKGKAAAKAVASAAAADAAPPAVDPVLVVESQPAVAQRATRPEDFDDDETVHQDGLSQRAQDKAAGSGRRREFAAPPPTNVVPGRRERSLSPPAGAVVLPGAPARSSGRSALGSTFEPPPPTSVLPGRRGRLGGAAAPAPAVEVVASVLPARPPVAGAHPASDLFDEDDDPTLLDQSPLLTPEAAAAEKAAGPSTNEIRRSKKNRD